DYYCQSTDSSGFIF
nr:immunoglobulin light chain junction region [Macaca mulatta]MOV72667.1 immunoglobulin light chain junction region [Macaca mulatta]MOV73154.1 immunoglobulin light chain junction region [Macaca mulatta]MOV73212.1 immunoglobulin light chain junction region [Macaca mulatta]MOV73267.1 immunoglobulin light chain junction region [Macaca mulatta]